MRICGIEDCERIHKAHGLCSMHYRRKLINGLTERPRDGKDCAVNDCIRKCTRNLYCDKHYYRYKKYGNPLVVKERYQKKDYSCHELFESSYQINADNGCWEWENVSCICTISSARRGCWHNFCQVVLRVNHENNTLYYSGVTVFSLG